MTQVLSQFTPAQRSAVEQLGSPSEIPVRCPLSFNGLSSCYAAISFSDMVALKNTPPNSVNYTIFVDPGLNFVDVVDIRVMSRLAYFPYSGQLTGCVHLIHFPSSHSKIAIF